MVKALPPSIGHKQAFALHLDSKTKHHALIECKLGGLATYQMVR